MRRRGGHCQCVWDDLWRTRTESLYIHTSRSMGGSLAGWWEEENKMFENFRVRNATCPRDVGVSTNL